MKDLMCISLNEVMATPLLRGIQQSPICPLTCSGKNRNINVFRRTVMTKGKLEYLYYQCTSKGFIEKRGLGCPPSIAQYPV